MFWIILSLLFLIIYIFYSTNKKTKESKSFLIKKEVIVPNPAIASKEKIIEYLENTPSYIVLGVYNEFTENLNIDFNGTEHWYLQKIDYNFNANEARKSLNNPSSKIDIPDNVEFPFANKVNVNKQIRNKNRNKIPSKFLKPLKDLKDTSHFFYKKKVLISGTFNLFPHRAEIAKMLWEVGADVDTGVSKNLDILIIGDDAGWKKLEEAENQSVLIINEETFLSYFPNYERLFTS